MNTELKITKTVKKLIWPDDVRETMIEKSKFYYESDRVYQYGYYDGFQKAIENCDVLPSQLLKQRDEMLELLKDINSKIIAGSKIDYSTVLHHRILGFLDESTNP